MAKGRESKPHIGIFGRRNNGKSSFINALAGQDIAIVSSIPGTTTDPVRKSMEIFGIGPAILVDTAGLDDSGDLGEKRVKKSLAVLRSVDLAILILADNQFGRFEEDLIALFNKQSLPFILLHNKEDQVALDKTLAEKLEEKYQGEVIRFSSLHPDAMRDKLIARLVEAMPETAYKSQSLLGDLISKGDLVLLVTPIDAEAPEGRMILPQMQAVRDILDNHCIAVLVRETELAETIAQLRPRPVLVVTDSQAFELVNRIIPEDIPLTGFSVMLARHKGDFEAYLHGTPKISQLKDGDRILVLESCTHHVVCDDIGRDKIPRWMREFTGKQLHFDTVSGLSDLIRPIEDYALVVQCGACMITRRQLMGRLQDAREMRIPITNYGMAIAWMHGIYQRAIAPFLK